MDADRIGPICDRLKAAWSCHPDIRLGQLMDNIRIILKERGRDIFYVEDSELISIIEDVLYQG